MTPTEYLQSHYERLGRPNLTNFELSELDDGVDYQFGAFAVADHNGRVVLIRRTPIKEYPGIENYWWIFGGGQEGDEQLDETVVREFREETGLRISVARTLLAQLARDRPFVAVFFRGTVVDGAVSADCDPDRITAEARSFPPAAVPLSDLWTDADKILLVQEGFAVGEVEPLIAKNGLGRGGAGRALHSSDRSQQEGQH